MSYVYTPADVYKKIPGSKYFTWHEALYLPRLNSHALPTEAEVQNIISLAIQLDRVREYFGKPITITSWLRPLEYNKLIGGAPMSFHRSGLAVDFVIEGTPIQEAKLKLQNNKALWPYRGEFDTTNWIHLDMGGDQWFYGYPKRRTT